MTIKDIEANEALEAIRRQIDQTIEDEEARWGEFKPPLRSIRSRRTKLNPKDDNESLPDFE